ncbi:MAG: acetyl-coenzyme A carboxylase carboxyl transferase subunit alpha [Candidatus Hydrogenedentota bacterium]
MESVQPKPRAAVDQILPFERPIADLEERLEHAVDEKERSKLKLALDRERERIFADLTPWQRVQLARHPQRPRMLDYVFSIFEDFIELHGDRLAKDDRAMVGGIARFHGQTVVVVGQQKGVSTEEKVSRNFGMAHPEGYRKSLRLFKLAERLHLPVITLVDTPAAHLDIDAERGGQGPAIAENLLYLMGIKTPVCCILLGEGGSGGALAIAVGDWIAMLEHAMYVICPPEQCAEILWRDADKKELAASAMRVTARELLALGVIDSVVPEPGGGAHRSPAASYAKVAEEIARFLDKAAEGAWAPEKRQDRFRKMGAWLES